MRSLRLAVLVALAPFALPACSTYRDELARSQRSFEENRHEQALAVLRMLEPDTSHLDPTERARYAYLRGMTDFRIGYKADARHWLAVAKALDEDSPGLLSADWRTRLDQSLAELDAPVWTGGMESLTNAKKRPESSVTAPKSPDAVEQSTDEEESTKPAPKKKKKPVDEDE